MDFMKPALVPQRPPGQVMLCKVTGRGNREHHLCSYLRLLALDSGSNNRQAKQLPRPSAGQGGEPPLWHLHSAQGTYVSREY